MSYLAELMLPLKMGVARARLRFPANGASAVLKERVGKGVRAAFPGIAAPAVEALYLRHRMSMQKFSLIKQHLGSLTTAQLNNFIDRHVQIEGREHLDLVMDSNAPVIFVTPHYGNFAAGCLKLIKEVGHRKTVNAFYDSPLKNRSSEGFTELFHRLGYGFNALFNDDTAVLKAFRVLKRGEALTMMPDVYDISGHVLYVPFFGRLIPAMAGTAMFALKSHANVIVGHNCPGRGLGSTLKLNPPLHYEHTGDLESDIASLTAALFAELETQIREAPEHWIYLQNLSDLLSDRLSVDCRDHADWLDNLETSTRQFASVLPEWPAIVEELRSIPLDPIDR